MHKFIRRFLIHVLPSGFHRIRHYGWMANPKRVKKLARARELLQVEHTAQADATPAEDATTPASPWVCPTCSAPMIVMGILDPYHSPRAPPGKIGHDR